MELWNDVQEMGKLREPQIMDIASRMVRRNAGGKRQGLPQKLCTDLEGLEENEIEVDESVVLELLRQLDEQKLKSSVNIESSPSIIPKEETQNFKVFQNFASVCPTVSETSEQEERIEQGQYRNFYETDEVGKNATSFRLEAPKLVHKPIKRVVHVPITMVKEECEISEISDFMDSFEEFLNDNIKAAEVPKVLEVGNDLICKSNLLSINNDKVVKAKVHVPIKPPKEEIESFLSIQKFEKSDDSMDIEVSNNGKRIYNLTEVSAIESNEEIHDCSNIARFVDADSEVEDSPTAVSDGNKEIYCCEESLLFKKFRTENEGGLVCSNNSDTLVDISSEPTKSILGFTRSDSITGENTIGAEGIDFNQLSHRKIDEVTVSEIEKALNVDFLSWSNVADMPEEVPDDVEVLACRSFIAEEMDAILVEIPNGSLEKDLYSLLEPSEIERETGNELFDCNDHIFNKTVGLTDMQEVMEANEVSRNCGNAEESIPSQAVGQTFDAAKHAVPDENENSNLEKDGHNLLEPSGIMIEPVKTRNEIISCDDSNESTTVILTDMQEDEERMSKRVNAVEIGELFQRQSGGDELLSEDIPVENKDEELNINLEIEDIIEDKIEVTDIKIQDVNDQKVYEIIEANGCQFIVIDEAHNISVVEETQKGENREKEETRKRQCDDLEEFGRSNKIIKLDEVTNEDNNQNTATETIVIDSDCEEMSGETANLTKETQKRKCDNTEEHAPSPKIAKVEPIQVQKRNENFVPHEPLFAISRVNPLLARLVLRNPITSTWHFSSHYPYMLCNLIQQSPEYERVKKIFKKTATRRMTVSKIYRVENPYLLGMYLMKKEKMERTRDRSHQVIERQLFHGTRQENIDGICRYNFDWRRRGQSRGHKFGQGVSFSPKASYARHYNFGDDVMFLARVLVSRMVEGSQNTVVPPEPYDTTRNHTGDVIVKYDDDDFYPQYIIYYYYMQGCGFFFNC